MIVLFDRRFGGGYTKFMACVNIPFVLPCLETNCKEAAAESKQNKHWYVVGLLRPLIFSNRLTVGKKTG